MTTLIKAMLLGGVLSWVVSTFVAASESTGGLLQIQHVVIRGANIDCSLPVFALGTALAWAILALLA